MDCSKTIDFFAEAKRFCNSRTACVAGKEQCPLFVFCERPLTKICAEEAIEEAKKAMKSLQKWSDEHPEKTYALPGYRAVRRCVSNQELLMEVNKMNCKDCIHNEVCYIREAATTLKSI